MTGRNLMTTEPTKPPDSASPSSPPRPGRDPVSWLLEAARRVPVMAYAIAVVGLSAAAALSTAFVFGNYLAAIYGAAAVLGAMMIVRLYAVAKPTAAPIDVGLPAKVLVWAGVVAFIVVLGLGVAKLGIVTFQPPGASPGSPQPPLTAGPDKAEAAPSHPAADIESTLAGLARERIKLRKRGEAAGPADYLGVLRLELSSDHKTAIVVVEPMGDYQTQWSVEECESQLELEINRVKNDHPDSAIRNLNITKVALLNRRTPGSADLISYTKFSDIPGVSLTERLEAKARIEKGDSETAKKARDSGIRYHIDPNIRLSGIDDHSANMTIRKAIASWQQVVPVFSEAKDRIAANLVIMAIPFENQLPGRSEIGPPVGEQLRLHINTALTWNLNSLEATVCHELGHSLGITHNQITHPHQLMQAVLEEGISTPQDQDIELARKIWDLRVEPRSFSSPSSPLLGDKMKAFIAQAIATDDPFSNASLLKSREEAIQLFVKNRPITPPVLQPPSYFLEKFKKNYETPDGTLTLAGTKHKLLATNAVAKAMLECADATAQVEAPPEKVFGDWVFKERQLVVQLTKTNQAGESILSKMETIAWKQFLKEWRDDAYGSAPERFVEAMRQAAYEIIKAGLEVEAGQASG
jgi:hypothetical protein